MINAMIIYLNVKCIIIIIIIHQAEHHSHRNPGIGFSWSTWLAVLLLGAYARR